MAYIAPPSGKTSTKDMQMGRKGAQMTYPVTDKMNKE